jgi:hypothetical protein
LRREKRKGSCSKITWQAFGLGGIQERSKG